MSGPHRRNEPALRCGYLPHLGLADLGSLPASAFNHRVQLGESATPAQHLDALVFLPASFQASSVRASNC